MAKKQANYTVSWANAEGKNVSINEIFFMIQILQQKYFNTKSIMGISYVPKSKKRWMKPNWLLCVWIWPIGNLFVSTDLIHVPCSKYGYILRTNIRSKSRCSQQSGVSIFRKSENVKLFWFHEIILNITNNKYDFKVDQVSGFSHWKLWRTFKHWIFVKIFKSFCYGMARNLVCQKRFECMMNYYENWSNFTKLYAIRWVLWVCELHLNIFLYGIWAHNNIQMYYCIICLSIYLQCKL